jgi:hypothetical protein
MKKLGYLTLSIVLVLGVLLPCTQLYTAEVIDAPCPSDISPRTAPTQKVRPRVINNQTNDAYLLFFIPVKSRKVDENNEYRKKLLEKLKILTDKKEQLTIAEITKILEEEDIFYRYIHPHQKLSISDVRRHRPVQFMFGRGTHNKRIETMIMLYNINKATVYGLAFSLDVGRPVGQTTPTPIRSIAFEALIVDHNGETVTTNKFEASLDQPITAEFQARYIVDYTLKDPMKHSEIDIDGTVGIKSSEESNTILSS